MRRSVIRSAALGAALAVGVLAGAAQAKPWAKWAPAPLASDGDYASMSARPADSLLTGEFAWLTLQRDWRAQRAQESSPGPSPTSLSADARGEHRARSSDKRFAELASRPYATLTNQEFAWLVSESAAQRADGDHMSTGGMVATTVVVSVIVAVVAAGIAVGAALNGIFGGN
jgi:hypothetical protein